MDCLNAKSYLCVMGSMRISFGSWSTYYLAFLIISSGFDHLQISDALTDTILQGQSISTSRQTNIASAGGNFELGFFRPGNSTKYYVGIWYKKVSDRTVVWVANRDFGFENPSVVFTLSTDGNLEMLDGKVSYKVTSSISSKGSNSSSATLLDSGNLVLRDNRSNITLWQSFDYPSHTFLPGMKMGYDRRAGKTWSLTSWKSLEDPSPGGFSLEVDPNGTSQFFILQGSTKYWTSGPWDGNSYIFSLVPEMRLDYIFNYSYYSSEDQNYFTYSLYNSSIISRAVLDVSGQIKQLSWLEGSHQWYLFWAQPRTPCEVYAYCGPFGICNDDLLDYCECLPEFEPASLDNWKLGDRSGGCKRKTELQCGNTTTDANWGRTKFHLMSNVRLPEYPLTLPARSATECKSDCLHNCSCSAYAYENDSCTVWGGDLLNLRQKSSGETGGRTFFLKLAVSKTNGGVLSSKWKVWLIVILAISVTFTFVIWGIRRKLQRKGKDLLIFDFSNSSEDTKSELSDTKRLRRAEKEVDLPIFSFASVSSATDNFSVKNKLGEGGFGPVYKGKSQKGYEVAVKRLSKRSGQGWEELKNEAILIAKLQHKNLVKLLGCCIEQDEKILIYEYLPNKSLDFFLFDPANHGIIYWETRVHIIEGIAQGLLYLHQYSRLRIIHRDLKASNILLDEEMNPKISDFGMARIFGDNESKATNHIVGTYGYMSPEYALEGLFSIKSDVFSFGVLLLEILSGKKNTGFYQTDSLNLLGYAWDLWKEGRGHELMDPILDEETVPRHILLRYINVGLLCVQEIADDRPAMSDVVSMLGNESVSLPSPKQPAYSNLRSGVEPHIAQNRPEICSLNGVTLSIMEAR